MSDAWKRLDLGGDGLQAVNRRLAGELRRRPVAYALLGLFPLGAHRWYLREPFGAVAYPLLCALAAWWWPAPGGWGAAAATIVMVAFDAWWIERRIASMNRAMRRRAFLGDRPPPPAGFAGRVEESRES